MANSAPWADHRSSDCSGHCALGRLCSDVVWSAKFHMGHRPTVPGARRTARPDHHRRVRIPIAVGMIDSIAQSWLVFKQGAELAQAIQCLIFGTKDRKNGKEPYDVKDLLD